MKIAKEEVKEMKRLEFINELIKAAKENKFEIEIKDVLKNNGINVSKVVVKTGLNIEPAVDLESLYDVYTKSDSIYEVIKMLKDIVETAKNKAESLDVSRMFDNSDILACVINKERNKDLLEAVPHIDFLDLAVVFRYKVSDVSTENEKGTVLINNNLVEKLKLNTDEVFKKALDNQDYELICFDPFSFDPFSEDYFFDSEGFNVENLNHDMNIVGNKDRLFGATFLYEIYRNEKLREQIYEKIGNFIVLPSSVHEVIIAPYPGDYEKYKTIVREVNQNEVDEKDYLSDSVYVYEKEKGEIVAY